MKVLLAVFCAALLGTNTSAVLDGCFDPPGNGPFADLVVKAIEAVRPLLYTGIPSLGIPPLDPLGPNPPISFHIDTSGIRMDGTIDETQVKNLAQFILCSVNISLGLSQTLSAEFRINDWRMEGMYELDGLIASLFPVFGDGNFRIDTYETGLFGTATVSYNPFTDRASIKNLDFDVFFKRLEMEMECINGCGDMSDLINGVISQIGPAVFDAAWNALEPPIANLLEAGINDFLKNISISDIISSERLDPLELGNGNVFVDSIMDDVNEAIVEAGLDPTQLQDASLNLAGTHIELYDGEVVGLSKMHRGGTCTLDKVASWVFLYANLDTDDLKVHYKANVTSDSSTSLATAEGTVKKVAVYAVARKDTFGMVTDIDQFVITEFGPIDINIDGLGPLGYIVEPLTEALMNLVHEDISNMLETDIKDLLEDVLGETPWPPF